MFKQWPLNIPVSVLLLGALTGVAFGFQFGYGNQTTYLVSGLRLLDPQYLANDWWATETVQYHRRFAYLVLALGSIGSLPWILATVNALAISVGAVALFRFASHLSDDQRTATYCWLLTSILFFGITGTISVAGSNAFTGGIQPSGFAAVFLILAMLTFATGRFAVSGVFLALSGLAHTNFLLLGLPVFGFAHLLIGRSGLVRRGVIQFWLPVVVLLFELPIILQVSAPGVAPEIRAEASRILSEIRAPHHYNETSFLLKFLPLLAWHAIAITHLKYVKTDTDFGGRLLKLYWSFLVLLVFGFVATVLLNIDTVSRLFVWRMAPFSLVLAFLIIAAAATQLVLGDKKASWDAYPAWRLGILSFGALALGVAHIGLVRGLFASLILVGILWFARRHWSVTRVTLQWPARRSVTMLGLGTVILLGTMFVRVPSSQITCQFNLFVSGCDEARNELYSWARTGTDPGAVFLIPPNLEQFRLLGRRAVVISWKDVPLGPEEILQWYGRIDDISGGILPESFSETKRGYAALDDRQIEQLVQKYDVDYVVRGILKTSPIAEGQEVFRNTDYFVLPSSVFSVSGPVRVSGPVSR